MGIEYLFWDSDFFQLKVGRILLKNSDGQLLQMLLEQAKNDGFELIYLFGNQDLIVDDTILATYHGSLVDRKVLYEKSIENSIELISNASEYVSSTVTEDIISLGYLSGIYSRYFVDKNFHPDDFYKLYRVWIEKSISHQIANHVFCVYENEKAIGFSTLKIDAGVGHIGLIAVSEHTQGKGIGRSLMNACINKLIEQRVAFIEVPTQLANEQACMFYEKCGFQMKSITSIYHFWLNNKK